jgi:uroporphyrinogen-III synthase
VLVASPRNADAAGPDALAERGPLVAIGPTTAQTLREAGHDPVTLDRPTPDALLEILR